jgi:hypothetical protein
VAQDVQAHAAGVVKQAYDAMDLNHDGKIDTKDAAVAKPRVAARIATMKQAASKVLHSAASAGHRAVDHLQAEIKLTAKRVFDAADRNHDGKVDAHDAVAGANQASAAMHQGVTFVAKEVADGAKQLYDGAASQAKQAGTTLKNGFDDAKRILAGTWAKSRGFS